MMNIIIKLKTRIKKKINEMKGIESKTTDKNKIIEATTASATIALVKTATDKKSKIIKTTQSMTMSTMNTAMSCQRRKRNSIELRMIQINNKIAGINLSITMKKMKSIVKSTNKDSKRSPNNPKEAGKKTEEAEGELAEARKSTCPKTELRVRVLTETKKAILITTRGMARVAKDTDPRTTSTTIKRVAKASLETTTKEAMVGASAEAKAVMERSTTIASTTERVQLATSRG